MLLTEEEKDLVHDWHVNVRETVAALCRDLVGYFWLFSRAVIYSIGLGFRALWRKKQRKSKELRIAILIRHMNETNDQITNHELCRLELLTKIKRLKEEYGRVFPNVTTTD